ncbi:hypothetical protein [Amycolatopsis lexingtonensis]|uniref:hypothetical protein n=1 Tax=Amycolatopsis lexingtonensis TaxID=218822 RepID=UPI003F7157D2
MYSIRSDALNRAVELALNGDIPVADVVPTAEAFNTFLDDVGVPAPGPSPSPDPSPSPGPAEPPVAWPSSADA